MRTPARHILHDDLLTLAKQDVGPVSQHELKVARGLATISEHGHTWRLHRRPRKVGLVRFGSVTVTVPPNLPTRTFLGLVYFLYDISLEELGVIDVDDDLDTSDLFRGALAMGLVRSVETIARRHIDQSYEVYRERLQILRGRPLWRRELGRVRDGSIECEFAVKVTDSLLNRLLLAGLLEARRCLTVSGLGGTMSRQLVTWEGLATRPAMVERHDFSRAFRRLTRQTQAYAPALRLCEALLFGIGDPHDRLEGQVALPVYDLSMMFDKLLQALVAAIAEDCGRSALPQTTFDQVLFSGTNEDYRKIRPDAVVADSEKQPVAIFDAKYKPQYTQLNQTSRWSHRVTRGDIFQLFFYADRIRERYGRISLLPAYIAAPRLNNDAPMPSSDDRTIHWTDNTTGLRGQLQVVPIPVVPIIDRLIKGDSPLEAAYAHAGELRTAVMS